MDHKQTWQNNASSHITLNSIFAALAGVLIPLTILDSVSTRYKLIELALLVCSFLLFALSAEQTTNALDEHDAKKYVYYMIWYNLGVILLGAWFAVETYAHFAKIISQYFHLTFPLWIPLAVATVMLLSHWIYDFCWLIATGTDELSAYLDELQDLTEPRPDPSWLMRLFYRLKKINTSRLPHQGVYTRLKPSPLHGVGVFAIRDILQGTLVFAPDDDATVEVRLEDIKDLLPEMQQLYKDFCVLQGDKYICPVNFNKLTPGWYANNSDHPNIAPDEQLRFRAIRDISAGEELTSRYKDYSDND